MPDKDTGPKLMRPIELVARLQAIRERCEGDDDPRYYQRQAHEDADAALLEYIGNKKVKKAFDAIDKWYA